MADEDVGAMDKKFGDITAGSRKQFQWVNWVSSNRLGFKSHLNPYIVSIPFNVLVVEGCPLDIDMEKINNEVHKFVNGCNSDPASLSRSAQTAIQKLVM